MFREGVPDVRGSGAESSVSHGVESDGGGLCFGTGGYGWMSEG